MKYLTREWDITDEEYLEDDEDKMKIYEGKYKAWEFLIIILIDIPFGLVRQCDKNAHESRKAIINKYEVSDEKQESLIEVTNSWRNCRIKDTSHTMIYVLMRYLI